jgi:hypothetical protein
VLVSVLAALALSGCEDGRENDRAQLPAAPAGVVAGCREAAQDAAFEVQCPAGWPTGGERTRLRSFGEGTDAYLLEAQTGFGARSPVFHVLIGGQRKPFRAGFEGDGRDLRVTTRTVDTPVTKGPGREPTGELFAVERPTRRLRYVDVGGERGALLKAPPYPTGGIHGGHAIVMWNEDGHGYLVSTHSELSQRAAADMALHLARSYEPVD